MPDPTADDGMTDDEAADAYMAALSELERNPWRERAEAAEGRLAELEAAARQALWACLQHAGADTSGWDGPDHPSFETLAEEAEQAVVELRTDYYAEPGAKTLPGDQAAPKGHGADS